MVGTDGVLEGSQFLLISFAIVTHLVGINDVGRRNLRTFNS